MKITLEEIGHKTHVTYNGKTKQHKTAFLKKLSYSDAINYLKELK